MRAINQIKAGAVLNYIIIGLNTIVGLLYTPYMLSKLGQNEYGLYSLVASIIAYLTLLDFGFGNAIIRYTAKFRAENELTKQHEMFGMFIIVYSIIGIFAFMVGIGLYYNVNYLFERTMSLEDLNQARIMMLLLTVNLAFTFPLSVFGSIISAYENFVFQRVITIIRIVLSTMVMIALLSIGFKAIAMVVVQTVFNLLVLLSNVAYCFYKLKIRVEFKHFNVPFFKEISKYSFWIFLNAIIDKVYWGTGQFILGTTVGTVAVAIFSVGILFQQMFMSFSYALSNVLLPKITRMITLSCSSEEISSIFIKTGRLQSFVLQFIICGFVIFGNKFITLWAGIDYAKSYYIILIFFFSLYIPAIQSTAPLVLQAKNQMRFRTLVFLAMSLISIFCQFFFSQIWGEIGCAAAIGLVLLLGQGAVINIYYYYVQKLDIIKFWKQIMRMWIPALPILAIGFFSLRIFTINHMAYLILLISIFSLIYLIFNWRFGLNPDERSMFLSPIRTLMYRHG